LQTATFSFKNNPSVFNKKATELWYLLKKGKKQAQDLLQEQARQY